MIHSISLELPKIENDSQIIEPKLEETILPEDSQSSQILPLEDKSKHSLPDIPDQPVVDTDRERTLSDASSATVDYDFDSETCAVLTSNSVDI